MNTRCPRCGGNILRSYDEAACVACGYQAVVPVRAWDVGGDICKADRERHPEFYANGRGTHTPGISGPRQPGYLGREKRDGCKVHSSCLTCPLTRCVYDHEKTSEQRAHRNQAMVKMALNGASCEAIALYFNMSQDTVARIIANAPTKARLERNERIVELHRSGMPAVRIASRFGLTKPTVMNIIRQMAS